MPMASRNHEMSYLPRVFKISEDNFSYHLVEPGSWAMPIIGGGEDVVAMPGEETTSRRTST